MTLYILEIFLEESLEKASLILMISLILPLEDWVYHLLLELESDDKDWFFL